MKDDSNSVMHMVQSILPIKTDTSRGWTVRASPKGVHLRALSICQNWQPDHCSTSQFENKIGFFEEFLPKNHLLLTNYSIWRIWLESFYQKPKGNYHCDENGLAGQFWQMESTLRESWLYLLVSTLCAIHQCPCTIDPWTSRTVMKISSFRVPVNMLLVGGEV